MQNAYWNEQLIDLTTYPRECWHRLLHAERNHELHCPSCGKEVTFTLSLLKEPSFTHRQLNAGCTGAMSIAKHEIAAATETTIRLPKHISIQNEKDAKNSWKHPEFISPIQPFTLKTSAPFTSPHPFFKQLDTEGLSLDETQWEAVTCADGPLMILAGAGSGKTRVLTTRCAYLLCEKQVEVDQILMVTFSVKAAKEMKERIHSYPFLREYPLSRLVIGTFHSIFYRILRYHKQERYQSNHLLKYQWQQENILRDIAKDIHIDERDFPFDEALKTISFCKNRQQQPSELDKDNKWLSQVRPLYEQYEQRKKENGWFDFDDMLIDCLKLLQDQPHLLQHYQDRFRYMMVDEFQDINPVQYELIRLLGAQSKNVCIVGDDDQTIYAFRGSDPSLFKTFKEDFSPCKTITLGHNYRSSHEIVQASHQMIRFNKERIKKKVEATFSSVQKPVVFFPFNEEEEAYMIALDVMQKLNDGTHPSDIAILTRTNSYSRAIVEQCLNLGIPFSSMQGIDAFYGRPIVQMVFHYFRLSNDPNDEEALKKILPSLFLKASALNDIKAMSILHDCNYIDALQYLDHIPPFQKKKLKRISLLFPKLLSLSPLHAIERLEDEMGFGDYLKKRRDNGNQMERSSDDLKDLKVAFQKFRTIDELFFYYDDLKRKHETWKKQKQRGISITTIHQAKGLEFHTVYLIGTVNGLLPHEYALDEWRKKNRLPLEEERRLCYVAITRAKENLMISSPIHFQGKQATPSWFIKDMGEKNRARE